MKRKAIKTACITAATALMLGIFATPQTEVFNQTVNTQAKTVKTKYKNGKLKTKTITKYISKKKQKTNKLPNRIISKKVYKYNKKGKLTYKMIRTYKKVDPKREGYNYMYEQKEYKNYKKTNKGYRHTKLFLQRYWKPKNKKQFKLFQTYQENYNKKSGKIMNTSIIYRKADGSYREKVVRLFDSKEKKKEGKYYYYKNGWNLYGLNGADGDIKLLS